ncbi:MAG: GNAT family N-acetyltransferase [Desulfobacterales bacterium]
MLEDYPKEVILQDGLKFTLRPMTKFDDDGLYRFFVSLAEYDRKHLRNDTQNRVLIERWCRELNYDKVLPILAEKDKKIIGNATLHRQIHGWSKHIGEIRMTISPQYQQKGLGSLLVDEIVTLAEKAQLEKIMAWVVTSRNYVIKLFQQNQFMPVATLKNYVKSIHDGSYQDVVILVKDLKPSSS